jgi:hypothetical protein
LSPKASLPSKPPGDAMGVVRLLKEQQPDI